MSSIPANPAMASSRNQPAASAQQAINVDPIRIVKKYRWLLMASGVVGLVLGFVGNFLLAKYSPSWRPYALFTVYPPPSSNLVEASSGLNAEEMSRFMQTQVRFMTGDVVLQQVVEDPDLVEKCGNWVKPFMSSDGRVDTKAAIRQLRDIVSARVIPTTNLIELSVASKYRDDATSLVGLVRQKYLRVLTQQVTAQYGERTKSLTAQRKKYQDDIDAYQKSRESIIKTRKIENLAESIDAGRAQLNRVNENILKLDQELKLYESQNSQMQDQLKSPTGPVFNDDLRSEAEGSLVVGELKQRVSNIETAIQALINRGIGREHREYKNLQAQLDGANQLLAEKRDSELRRIFDGRLAGIQTVSENVKAQKSQLESERAELSARLVDLTQISAQLTDIDRNVNNLSQLRVKSEQDLNNIYAMQDLSSANRVIETQQESPPSTMSFPKLEIMLVAGLILCVGLVGGAVFLLEMLDQRIKAPSDVNMIPKTRLLGWLPDAGEDRDGGGAPETAFRDRPKGVVAEAVRQVRSSVSRRIQAADHRAILIVSAGPLAGATTVTSNLALAFGAADRRVLIIDANLRRPALHRVFGLQESPGLADVLSGTKTLDEAVQHTSSPNVDLLTVGSREHRMVERLAAGVKSQLISLAKSQYDLVLIDVAPAVVAGDAVALAHVCDATILVVRALAEKRGMVARLKNELAETRTDFLGVLVNGVKSSSGGYLKGNIRAAAEYSQVNET